MKPTMNRRTFSKTIAAGLGAAAVPGSRAAQSRHLQIGYTTLIWGATPRHPEALEPALKDISDLGFHKFETFAAVLEDWEKKGALGDLLARHDAPLVSAYSSTNLTDPSARKEELTKLIRWGKILKKHGGKFFVLAPNRADAGGYNFQQHRGDIIAALNEYAMAMNDLGLSAGLHQHTGTTIATRDQVYAVMEGVNTNHVKFAPDVGQLQKGGADAAKVVKDFLSITVHMHLKDWVGGKPFAGYCPLGQGKVDLKAILDMVEGENPDANMMIELDGSRDAPYTARETAEISKAYMQKLGYTFRT